MQFFVLFDDLHTFQGVFSKREDAERQKKHARWYIEVQDLDEEIEKQKRQEEQEQKEKLERQRREHQKTIVQVRVGVGPDGNMVETVIKQGRKKIGYCLSQYIEGKWVMIGQGWWPF